MKRKVAQIGPSTLMISLPNKWAKLNNIKKGDELEVETKEKTLTAYKGEHKTEEKEITMNIDKLSRYLLARYLEILYINNYNKIIFTYTKTEVYDDKIRKNINLHGFINKLKNRFIGMEIVSQTTTSTEFKCFILDKEESLEKIEKRIYFLMKEVMNELTEKIGSDYNLFHQLIYDHHDNISKFLYYYLRVLGESDKTQEEKNQLYSLYIVIDKLVDKIRHVSEMISEYGCSDKIRKILKEIFGLLGEQFEAMHKCEITSELVTKRYKLVQKVNEEEYNMKELRVINEVKIFLDTINDFSRVIIVKRLNK